MARFFRDTSRMRLNDSNQALTQHLQRLLEGQELSRLELAQRMGVSDGTLGRIKYGTANPTVDVVDRIARYFRVEPWELLKPPAAAGVQDQRIEYGPVVVELREAIETLGKDQQKALANLIHAFRAA